MGFLQAEGDEMVFFYFQTKNSRLYENIIISLKENLLGCFGILRMISIEAVAPVVASTSFAHDVW